MKVKWPSGLRRQLKALVRKGVGSNPTFIIIFSKFVFVLIYQKIEIHAFNLSELAGVSYRLSEGIKGRISNDKRRKKTKSMIRVGFEPTPFRTSALSWRLRPLGHLTFVVVLRLPSSLSALGSGLLPASPLHCSPDGIANEL